jgi:glycosyltransferase involved in cell wall biosynthesis
MRIQLAAPHCYPASPSEGSGLHPKDYPSGSGYHLHDLLAKGMAEEGHEVLYYLRKGAAAPPPAGVEFVSEPVGDADIYHAPIGPAGFAEGIEAFAGARGKSCLLTCHMRVEDRSTAPAHWIFVSCYLANCHRSERVVLNGIDPADFSFSAAKQDYLVFIGAMNRAVEKGLDIALALAQSKNVRLIAAGTGLDYETVARVSAMCAAAGAEYVGDVRGARKATLLGNARALLFPSRLNEGCPLVVLEAMMSGTPVLASRSGGTAEIVSPETGRLCARDEEWAAALDRVAEISPARCREIALERFHYRRMARDYLREYQAEIARTRESGAASAT